MTKPRQCEYGGLGLYDKGDLPNDRIFAGRCTCGAFVTVVDGRIPFHRFGENERPEPDEGTPVSPAELLGEGLSEAAINRTTE